MRILITGGCGFMGYHLAKFFVEKGDSITCLDNFSKVGSRGIAEQLMSNGVNILAADVMVSLNRYTCPDSFDAIFHLAAQTSAVSGIENPRQDFENNLRGTYNILEFGRRMGAMMIFWSSNKVYPSNQLSNIPKRELDLRYVWDGSSVNVNTEGGKRVWNITQNGISEDLSLNGGSRSIYGVTKACADLLCQEWAATYKIPIIINRFSCVAGTDQYGQEEQGWLSWFCAANLKNFPVRLFGWKGKQVRDILNVQDVCLLIKKQVERIDALSGEIFNIGGGIKNTLSLLEALAEIERITGRKFKREILDEARIGDQCIYISDIRKIKQSLDWEPTISPNETIGEIVDWMQSVRKGAL